jgi:hypothetical protein
LGEKWEDERRRRLGRERRSWGKIYESLLTRSHSPYKSRGFQIHSGHITRYPLPEPELPGTEPKLPEPVPPDANSGSESNYPKFYWVIRVVRPGTRTTRSTRTLQTSMIPLLAGWPGPTSAQVGIPSIMLLCRTRTTLLYCYSTSTCMFVVENFISIMLLKNFIMFEVFL